MVVAGWGGIGLLYQYYYIKLGQDFVSLWITGEISKAPHKIQSTITSQ